MPGIPLGPQQLHPPSHLSSLVITIIIKKHAVFLVSVQKFLLLRLNLTLFRALILFLEPPNSWAYRRVPPLWAQETCKHLSVLGLRYLRLS